ncbi:MAG: carbohydrate-binding protein [Planctomycetes bacterium]|nr:carbohydrate-binding protein [Planctomycetota bacterium]
MRSTMIRFAFLSRVDLIIAVGLFGSALPLFGQVLNKQEQLQRQTFWDNRDWRWYREQIPFFECPDAEITTTWYYRWELLTKHLTYGSPNTGYVFTEFIDRPFWSGTYGAISCPAGHQIYEARWLRSPRIANDYTRYWLETPGAQPRNYSTWLADSAWAAHLVHPDPALLRRLLPGLIKNFEGWEQRHYVPEVGLFWQTGHDDGMEFNINSRQTGDLLRGAEGYRPTLNAYLWADAVAIARMARTTGDEPLAERFQAKADAIRQRMQELLWDERRTFFLQVYRRDEERDGHRIQALSKTYETGQFAGSPHGRELIGYVPWQFGMPEPGRGYERAWKFLNDPDYFHAPFGPTTLERNDPMFLLQKTCCWWSGQSWPYATTQTLKALANLLQDYPAPPVSAADYQKLLAIYARSHRKDGRPYLAEALHPDTGSFEGHDGYNHSEHYFHSGFCDLVITGLVGLKPREDELLRVVPLASEEWDYFALDDLPYRGHRIAVVWDRLGNRYGLGKGLQLIVDGEPLARADQLGILECRLPPRARPATDTAVPSSVPPSSQAAARINFAVNNEGDIFPRVSATYTAEGSSLAKVQDGNYWYHLHPPNRWTCQGSPNAVDSLEMELGVPRTIDTLRLYFLDDESEVVPPDSVVVEVERAGHWMLVRFRERDFVSAEGHRPNTVVFDPIEVARLRLHFRHAAKGKTGLTEIEVWGDGALPYEPPPPPAGNLAFNRNGTGFPQIRASYSDRFGGRPERAIDGKIVYDPTPMNRWTSYESPNAVDWLELDFGEPRPIGRVELHLYDDRGGVQAPEKYTLETWDGAAWVEIPNQDRTPKRPAGGVRNTVRFAAVSTDRLRVLFTHRGQARSGLTEIEVWQE